MTTQIDYEAIARENGYVVCKEYLKDEYYWWCFADLSKGDVQADYSESEEAAYKACCVENNLVEGE